MEFGGERGRAIFVEMIHVGLAVQLLCSSSRLQAFLLFTFAGFDIVYTEEEGTRWRIPGGETPAGNMNTIFTS